LCSELGAVAFHSCTLTKSEGVLYIPFHIVLEPLDLVG
jgi:hypothetical protein